MLFKTLTRHAVLAKNFGYSSSSAAAGNSTSTPFFVSTNHLARYQSQVAVKGGQNGFGSSSSNGNHHAHSGSCAGGLTASGVNFSSFSPLTSLDDEKQQVVVVESCHHLLQDHSNKKHVPLIRTQKLLQRQQQLKKKVPGIISKRKSSTNDDFNNNNNNYASEKSDNHELHQDNKKLLTDGGKEEQSSFYILNNLQKTGDHIKVVEYFEKLRGKNIIPTIESYNVVLSSISTLICIDNKDLSPLMEVYSDMVNNKVTPDVEAYSIVIDGLLNVAKAKIELYNDSILFHGVSARHNINALNTVLSHLDVIQETKSYVELAVSIFNASNSVKAQLYSDELLNSLYNVCSLFEIAPPVLSEPSLTASKIKQYFQDQNVGAGIAEYEKHITDQYALQAVINGFIHPMEDYHTAWNWVANAEADSEFVLPMEYLESVLASFCSAGQTEVAAELFEHIANNRGGSNRAACDYIMLSIEARNPDNVYRAIQETQIRGGVWDYSTLSEVVKYLVSLGDIELSMKVLSAQSKRLDQYSRNSSAYTKVDFQDMGSEVLEDVFFHLKEQDKLDVHSLLSMATCHFYNKSVYYDIIQQLWGYKELSQLETLEILSLHNRWLRDARAIPTGIVGLEARENYKRLVEEIVSFGTPLNELFIDEVNLVLSNLGLEMGNWWDFTNKNNSNGSNANENAIQQLLTGQNIEHNYKYALQTLPPPSSSQEAWENWVPIHRAVISNGSKEVAMAAYQNLLEMGSYPDATGYGKLITADDAIDSASDALMLFNEAVLHVRPTTFLYNVLLAKLSKARRLQEAMMYFQDMENVGVKKSNVTYGTMISAACRAGDEELAKELFNEMEQLFAPSIAPFNIMLQYYVHTKRRSEALDIYNRLKQVCDPSPHTYKLLIDMYMIEPMDIKAAEQVLEMVPFATTQHYSALIYAKGAEMKDLEGAKAIFSNIKHHKADELIYQALLESYVVNGVDPSEILRDMEENRVKLNAYMANILIRGWAANSLEKSVGLFYHVLENKLAEPSSFESMIRAYLYHGDIGSATHILMIMKANSYPEPVVAKVEGLIETGNGDLIDSIFRNI